jgi:deoxyinosine 3'endonuclease (endonuclease V)
LVGYPENARTLLLAMYSSENLTQQLHTKCEPFMVKPKNLVRRHNSLKWVGQATKSALRETRQSSPSCPHSPFDS